MLSRAINFVFPPPFIAHIRANEIDEAKSYLINYPEAAKEKFRGYDGLQTALSYSNEDHAKVNKLVDQILATQAITVEEKHFEAALPFNERFTHLLSVADASCITSQLLETMVSDGKIDQFEALLQVRSSFPSIMHILASQYESAPFIRKAVDCNPKHCFSIVNDKNAAGMTPLMIAAQRADCAAVDALLYGGADYQEIVSDRKELAHGDYESHKDLTSDLMPRRIQELSTRLYKRSNENHFPFIQKHEINPSSVDKEGNTLFMQACKSRCFSTAMSLIKQEGYNFKEMNLKEQTPYIIAAQAGHEEAVAYLSKQGDEAILSDHKDQNKKDAQDYFLERYTFCGEMLHDAQFKDDTSNFSFECIM